MSQCKQCFLKLTRKDKGDVCTKCVTKNEDPNIKMDDASVTKLVNEVLFYANHHLESSTTDNLVELMVTFFTINELKVAKELIWRKFGDSGILEAWVSRRDSNNRSEAMAICEDTLGALTVMQTKNVNYVCYAANWSRVPKCNPERNNELSIVERMEEIEMSLKVYNSRLNATNNEVKANNVLIQEIISGDSQRSRNKLGNCDNDLAGTMMNSGSGLLMKCGGNNGPSGFNGSGATRWQNSGDDGSLDMMSQPHGNDDCGGMMTNPSSSVMMNRGSDDGSGSISGPGAPRRQHDGDVGLLDMMSQPHDNDDSVDTMNFSGGAIMNSGSDNRCDSSCDSHDPRGQLDDDGEDAGSPDVMSQPHSEDDSIDVMMNPGSGAMMNRDNPGSSGSPGGKSKQPDCDDELRDVMSSFRDDDESGGDDVSRGMIPLPRVEDGTKMKHDGGPGGERRQLNGLDESRCVMSPSRVDDDVMRNSNGGSSSASIPDCVRRQPGAVIPGSADAGMRLQPGQDEDDAMTLPRGDAVVMNPNGGPSSSGSPADVRRQSGGNNGSNGMMTLPSGDDKGRKMVTGNGGAKKLYPGGNNRDNSSNGMLSQPHKDSGSQGSDNDPLSSSGPSDMGSRLKSDRSYSNAVSVGSSEEGQFMRPNHEVRRERKREKFNQMRNNRGPIIGQADDTGLAAAPSPSRDFFISRVNREVTVERLSSYIARKGVQVRELVKTSHKDAVNGSFKLTIAFGDVGKIKNPAFWPKDIWVRKWKMTKSEESNNTGDIDRVRL